MAELCIPISRTKAEKGLKKVGFCRRVSCSIFQKVEQNTFFYKILYMRV
jgi:hypothetical protein